ncbi:MAG: zinc-dependent metalloprotease [Candidatus Nanopelagicales bacterium]
MAQLVDWPLAERIGLRFMPKGPTATPNEAHGTVAELRELAQLARDPVRELTGLDADPAHAPAVVVDRGEWIASNVAGMAVALDPFVASRADREANPAVEAVGARLTAAQLGGAMAWLSGKVLGQYEAFTSPGHDGRLLLVAPNIVRVERELDLVPRDFRFWVCLHEETHRAQFGGVAWMKEHFLAEVQALVAISDISASEFVARLGAVAQSVVGAARGRPGPSLMEAVQTPAQREVFDRLTGLMSLLEGHADYVMDEVGPTHVPTVDVIRARFSARRAEAGTVDGFVRRVLGLETKMRQYTSGADFVRAVIAKAGSDGFAQVWAAPANLPSAVEIEDPDAWVARVLA